LEKENIKEEVLQMIDEVIDKNIPFYLSDEKNMLGFTNWIKSKFYLDASSLDFSSLDLEDASILLKDKVNEIYNKREEKAGSSYMRQFEKMITLWVVDSRWKEHLLTMDSLKEGIHLRGYAQTDPLVAYQKESYLAFQEMIFSIKEGVADLIFKTKISIPSEETSVFIKDSQEEKHSEYSSLKNKKDTPVPVIHKGKKIGRNDPCPCGSGKKYKKCCGR